MPRLFGAGVPDPVTIAETGDGYFADATMLRITSNAESGR